MTRNKSAEWKVGLFVAIGIALLTTTLLRFSKSSTFLDSTYDLYVETEDISGLKPKAQVLLSGVQIGHVVGAELAENQRTVKIQLRLLDKYPLREGSTAIVEQAGFLGDKYIAIKPAEFNAETAKLSDGDSIPGRIPVGFEQIIKNADSFMNQASDAVGRVNRILASVEDNLLSEGNLDEFQVTLQNIRSISDRLKNSSEILDGALEESGPLVTDLSKRLNQVAADLESLTNEAGEILSENRDSIKSSLDNIKLTSLSLQETMKSINDGAGMAGALIQDAQLKSKLQTMVSNLTVLSSNLNEHGLLYKPKKKGAPFWQFWKKGDSETNR
jgi:phospholipid/cholesterol/gamma-HCH transport system substrate-binding protein